MLVTRDGEDTGEGDDERVGTGFKVVPLERVVTPLGLDLDVRLDGSGRRDPAGSRRPRRRRAGGSRGSGPGSGRVGPGQAGVEASA
ncbi:hypothetical protein [Kineococcus indalonis]|uniref:hypothetical protein n=1 Tax=Kineococcus indalonis TaxID=2696566 RepID=UPI001412569A|nr:hypothetical protein [Kineococcus indalonis]NAZ86895.1 hypothetical protein [Kineococcus indalonis]